MPKCPYQILYIYEIQGDLVLPSWLTATDYLGCWREGDCSYLFFTRKRETEVKKLLGKQQSERYISETIINYEDWEAGQSLVPLRIADFQLCPIWEEIDPEPGCHLIRLDPGVAFGSGFHPTTKLCLRLIQEIYALDRPATVLDLGTGTGILSLACLAKGANHTTAVDHNSLAIATAAKNARYNGVEEKIHLICGDAREYLALEADLLLANIYYALLRELLINPGLLNKQWYIFSGLVGTEIDNFLHDLQPLPLEPLKVVDENLWFAVLARRC